MRRLFVLLACLSLGAVGSAPGVVAQTIRGRVVEAEGGRPVPSALVFATWASGDSIGSTVTDTAGAFSVRTIQAGRVVLRIERIGYRTVVTAPIAVGAAETLSVEIEASRSPVPLEPIVVEAARQPTAPGTLLDGFIERQYWLGQKLGLGTFMDRDDIESRNAIQLSDLLRTVPGVQFSRTRSGGYVPIVGRRLDCGRSRIMLDGIWINRIDDEDVDLLAIPSMLEAVEVYRGAAQMPAEFGGFAASCGVIALWTRRGR